jgi:hypothetical protein
MHITKLKNSPKRAMKLSQTIWKRVLKMDSCKKDFEVQIFFSSQNIDFPFLFIETLGAFLFPSYFSPFF